MKTNIEKCNHWLALINEREQLFIDSVVMDKPEKFYKVNPSGGIETLVVESVSYNNRLYFGKKPRREDVHMLSGYYEDNPEMTEDKIIYHVKAVGGKYSYSTGISHTDLEKYFLSILEAQAKSKEELNRAEREKELLNNGHIRCSYCGKIKKEEESVSKVIIFQNSRPDPYSRSGYKRFVDRKTNKYCSNECGSYDQMAHEG